MENKCGCSAARRLSAYVNGFTMYVIVVPLLLLFRLFLRYVHTRSTHLAHCLSMPVCRDPEAMHVETENCLMIFYYQSIDGATLDGCMR